MAEEREAETDAAMNIFGCDWRQWPLGDRHASDEEVEAFMWGLRDPAGFDDWDLVFAPAVEENGNVQHNLIGELADQVFTDCEVRHYLTYTNPPLMRSRSNKVVEPEHAWLQLKRLALACYRSQTKTPSNRHFVEDLTEYLA
jgi:hypothetical protein